MSFPFNHAYDGAHAAKENNELENWVHTYLIQEGNHGLVTALKKETAISIDLIKIPLSLLNRIVGPEPVEDRETVDTWEERVSGLLLMIQKGYQPPPLIVTDFWKPMEIVDGNHRHEALQRNGATEYWAIFFIKNESSKQLIAQYITHEN